MRALAHDFGMGARSECMATFALTRTARIPGIPLTGVAELIAYVPCPLQLSTNPFNFSTNPEAFRALNRARPGKPLARLAI